MNHKFLHVPTFLLAAGLAACAAPEPQDAVAVAPAAPAEPSPEEQQAMMMAMVTAGTPGPEHEEIMTWTGDWTVKLRARMSPDAPWEETAGTAKFSKTLGGRYIVQKLNCTMKMSGMEMPFDSLEIFGFNNTTKNYEAWWFDSMSTTAMHTQGRKVNGVIELRGMMKDPITPDGRPVLFTHRSVDENHFFGEGYDTIPPHGMIKVIELEFTRVIP